MVRRLDLWLSTCVLALLVPYWLVWSWVGPVTNGDAQVYNLARLWLVDADGLFFNRSYTAITQIVMPWSFDAVHYPFLHLRLGYALPSFVCLLGMMLLVYAWVRERGGAAADGWRACLGFMAMPMAVMQATTTRRSGPCLLPLRLGRGVAPILRSAESMEHPARRPGPSVPRGKQADWRSVRSRGGSGEFLGASTPAGRRGLVRWRAGPDARAEWERRDLSQQLPAVWRLAG